MTSMILIYLSLLIIVIANFVIQSMIEEKWKVRLLGSIVIMAGIPLMFMLSVINDYQNTFLDFLPYIVLIIVFFAFTYSLIRYLKEI